jgi:hypothetical protein
MEQAMINRTLSISFAIIFSIISTSFGCAQPAQFELVSMDVNPKEIFVGESTAITVTIKNIGGTEGGYPASITVNQSSKETKNVIVKPGTSETVKFTLIGEYPSAYKIQTGTLSSVLIVKNKMVTKEFELKYDNGTSRTALPCWGGGYALGWSGGYSIDFLPPAKPFTITLVKIAGEVPQSNVDLSKKNFDLQVLDKDLKVIYSENYLCNKFPSDSVKWVDFQIPNIVVNDKFYIHVVMVLPGGMVIGSDDTVINEHSELTVRSPDGLSLGFEKQWPFNPGYEPYRKNHVNWMIRVNGTATVKDSK